MLQSALCSVLCFFYKYTSFVKIYKVSTHHWFTGYDRIKSIKGYKSNQGPWETIIKCFQIPKVAMQKLWLFLQFERTEKYYVLTSSKLKCRVIVKSILANFYKLESTLNCATVLNEDQMTTVGKSEMKLDAERGLIINFAFIFFDFQCFVNICVSK